MNMKLTFAALLAASLATGCVSILPDPAPAPAIYRLKSNAVEVRKMDNPETIRIDRPGAFQIFNSSDIVVTLDGQKLSAVAQAKWSEVTPSLIQESVIEALAGSRSFVGLLPSSGARTETRLHLSIQNFEANFDNGPDSAPLAIVQYRVTYARSADRHLLGTYTIREEQRADSIAVPSIVNAIERANNAAMSDIVIWLESKRAEFNPT